MIDQHGGHCCLPQLFETEFERGKRGNSLHSSCEIDLDGKAWQDELSTCDHHAASGMRQVSIRTTTQFTAAVGVFT